MKQLSDLSKKAFEHAVAVLSWAANIAFLFCPGVKEKLRMAILKFLLSRHEQWMVDQTSPINYATLALIGILGGKNPKLYEFQDVLPKLPVPKLESTLEKYLRSVRPLLTDEEFRATKLAVDEFKAAGGVGHKLQEMLIQRYQATPHNWLEEWWENLAYLSGRYPLPINSNIFGLDKDKPYTSDQVVRSASFLTGALEFKNMVDSEELEPLRMFGTVPLCMYQYSRMFGTNRTPGLERDSLDTFNESRHIAVLCKNQIFWFDVYSPDGEMYSTKDFEKQFRTILDMANKKENINSSPIGILTSEARPTWAEAREKIRAFSPSNKEAIDAIERALFLIVLEDHGKDDLQERCRNCFYGDGHNRWFDKSLSIIIDQKARVDPHCEHSWADAPITALFVEFVLAREMKAMQLRKDSIESPSIPPVHRGDIKTNSEINTYIKKAEEHYVALTANGVETFCEHFTDFGKNVPKALRMSPDAFCQMALQLSFYRMHKRHPMTYEAAQTRTFAHGRTETLRSCSLESCAWVRAMDQPDTKDAVKHDLLKKAVVKHVETMKDCMRGQGVDRHLLGLRVLAYHGMQQGLLKEMPSIFTDKAYQFNWTLSTSQTPIRHGPGGGFGPVDPHGYGVSYLVRENELYFHVSASRADPSTNTVKFGSVITQALRDMHAIAHTSVKKQPQEEVEKLTIAPSTKFFPSAKAVAVHETDILSQRQRDELEYARHFTSKRKDHREDFIASHNWRHDVDVDLSDIEKHFQRFGS